MRSRLATGIAPLLSTSVAPKLLASLGVLLAACSDRDQVVSPPISGPQFSQTAGANGGVGRITFTTNRDGNFQIYVMNEDGNSPTRLTFSGTNDFGPLWSPDGTRIVYGKCGDAACDVVVMKADGSGERVVAANGFPGAWSPDGNQIAFGRSDEVFIVNADGSGETNLTNTASSWEFPHDWSPDGTRILFGSNRDGADNPELYVMNVDGTGVVRLTDNPAVDARARWSPDGQRIVFASDRDGPDMDIFVMNADGSGDATDLTQDGFYDDYAAWSPDGTQIAFESDQDGDVEIYTIPAGGGGLVQLTNNFGIHDGGPFWILQKVANPATQVHFVANGDFASVNWSDVDPTGVGTFGFLTVSRGGPTNNPHTFLSYSVYQCDPFSGCVPIRDGFGFIPNQDLSGGGNSLTLRTNTTNNPNFTTSGPRGPVSVSWRANGLFTQSTRSTNEFSFPGVTHRSQDNSTSASANASGSIVGAPIGPTASGNIGTNHTTTIDRTQQSTAAIAAALLNAGGIGQAPLAINADGVPLSATGASSGVTTQFHFVSNGGFGSLSWSEVDPAGNFSFGSLSVSRGGPTNNPQTFLGYFVIRCDPGCNTITILDGFGYIPNQDLSGSSNSLRLRTNTTGNPNFITSGPRGLVSVNWRANGLYTQSFSGSNAYSFPGLTHRSQGSFTSASANATGSIVGVPIAPTASGDIGTNHQMTIDITRTPTGGGGGGPCVAPPDGLRAWWPGDGDTRDLVGGNHASGNFNIFVMKTSGSPPKQLTDVPGYTAHPNWSHDGRRITFSSCREGSSCEIYVMNADGSGQTKLTDDSFFDLWSVWSPDDKRIAFMSDRDGPPLIYVMNADGSNLTRLTDGGLDASPTWSPDGRRIAFERYSNGNYEIYVINADGSNLVNLTQSPAADGLPAWSPRGDKIAFASDRDGTREIYVMNADGSQPTRLTNNPADDAGPAWSPSGSSIAFVSNRDGNFEIYVMKPDGSAQKRVTNNFVFDGDPAWGTDQLLATATAQVKFAPAKVRDGFSFERAGQVGFASGAGIDDLQQLTIDAWVKHNSLPFGRVERYVTLQGEKAVLRYDGAAGFAQLHFYMRINGELQHIRVDNVLREGVFQHVAGSYDGSVMRLYLDGVEVGNLPITGTVDAGDAVLFSSGDETLDGVLDEIDIFNRALDPSEVRAIFDAGKAGKCTNGLPSPSLASANKTSPRLTFPMMH